MKYIIIMALYGTLLMAGKPIRNDKIIQFENYLNSFPHMPDKLLYMTKGSNEFSDSVFSVINFSERGNKIELEDSLFNFIYNISLVNGTQNLKEFDTLMTKDAGKIVVFNNKEDIVNLNKKNTRIFLISRVSYDKRYESILLLLKYEDQGGYSKYEHLYILNYIERKVLSIAKIAYSFYFDGNSSEGYTTLLSNNDFLLVDKSISSDVISTIEVEDERSVREPTYYTKFNFNPNGYLEYVE